VWAASWRPLTPRPGIPERYPVAVRLPAAGTGAAAPPLAGRRRHESPAAGQRRGCRVRRAATFPAFAGGRPRRTGQCPRHTGQRSPGRRGGARTGCPAERPGPRAAAGPDADRRAAPLRGAGPSRLLDRAPSPPRAATCPRPHPIRAPAGTGGCAGRRRRWGACGPGASDAWDPRVRKLLDTGPCGHGSFARALADAASGTSCAAAAPAAPAAGRRGASSGLPGAKPGLSRISTTGGADLLPPQRP